MTEEQGFSLQKKQANKSPTDVIIYKFVKFVNDASFQHANNSGASSTILSTTPEMSNFPKFSLSLPKIRKFSKEFKENAVSAALGPVSVEAVEKQQMENDNMGFVQAEDITEFMRIGFERKLLKLKDIEYDDVQIKSIGSKILLAGNDTTVHNFLQEYVPALQQLQSVKNMALRKNT